MKIETRTRRRRDEHGYEDIWSDLVLVPETDAESRAIDLLGDGKIPTAIIRHNRARGKHQVSAMSDIVVELKRLEHEETQASKQLKALEGK